MTQPSSEQVSNDSVFLSDIEKEISILLSVRQAIQSMVNRGLLSISDDHENMTIRPNDYTHAKLFGILLVDFISPTNPIFGTHQSYLDALELICNNPHFNNTNSIQFLKEAVSEFKEWLSHDTVFDKIWLGSIEQELDLTMKREEFLRICGDISKHNILRLSRTVQRILRILRRSNPEIQIADAYKAIDDFYEWFQNDIFLYHLTKLSELLNNISWGIQDYLAYQYSLSYTIDPEKSRQLNAVFYFYKIPETVTSELGRFYFWDLMNEIRAQPYIPRFKAWSVLEKRY